MTSLGYASFTDILTEVGNFALDTSATRKTVIKAAVNRKLAFAAQQFAWPQLLIADATGLRKGNDTALATFESGESEFPLPFTAGRLHAMHFQVDHTGFIEVVSAAELFERAGSQLNTTGRPAYVAQVGTTAQIRRLATSGTVRVNSDVATNDNTQTVRVYFRRGSSLTGERTFEDVAGAFSTNVAISSSVAAGYPIEMVSLPSAWAGTCKILAADDTELVVIPPAEWPTTASNASSQIISHPLCRCWRVPDADYKMTVIYKREPVRLVEDGDVPEIPVASYLIEAGIAEVLRQRGKSTEARLHDAEAGAQLRAAIAQNSNTRRAQITPARGNVVASTGGVDWIR